MPLSSARWVTGNTRLRDMLHPGIGQYLNNTDSGKVEQWDGFKWQTIGPSGNPKNTPTPDPEALDAALARAAGLTSEGHGGGSYVSGGAPLYSGGTPPGGGVVAPPTPIVGSGGGSGPGGQGQGGQGQSGTTPPVTGLHQVVLLVGNGNQTVSYGGFNIQPGGGGPVPMVWNGSNAGDPMGYGGLPPVIQDTDGYSGAAGDWQYTGPHASAKVPAWLGGTYRVGFEQLSLGTAWWPTPLGSPESHPPAPHAVAYTPAHGTVAPGNGILIAGGSCTYDIRVNGVTTRSKTVAIPPYTNFNQGPTTFMDEAGVAVGPGKVVSITLTWHQSWDVCNYGNILVAAPVDGVFYMTRTGP
jgi:hypothetical protein